MRLAGILVLMGLISFAWNGGVHAETRVALVIGNSNYQRAPRLTNPANDAALVAASFRRAGFQTVTARTDLDQAGFRQALQAFSNQARTADIAVVYYAGHGIEIGGVNYLVPVDATLASDDDVRFETIPLDLVLQAAHTRNLSFIIIDACRNNPFAAAMQHANSTRSVGRGLSRVEPEGDNVLVFYAARAGTTADDGDGANSPFATALANRLPLPNVELGLMTRQVRDDVMRATGNRQQPFTYGSISGDPVYFGGAVEPSTPPNSALGLAPDLRPSSGNDDRIQRPQMAALPESSLIMSHYPRQAAGADGRAMISCTVDAGGRLQDCSVQEESPAGVGFGVAALAIAPSFRLTPGAVNGVFQPMQVTVPITWIVPPPPPPPTPPSLPPPPTPRTFIVYIPLDQTELTVEGRTVVDLASEFARQFDGRIAIVGHSDRPGQGSAADPERLSELRARAVAQHLAGAGVDPGRMSLSWQGARQLAVEAPGSEPLNRRVEITVTPSANRAAAPGQ